MLGCAGLQVRFLLNVATMSQGGGFAFSGSDLHFFNSSLADNIAFEGAAFALDSTHASRHYVEGILFERNQVSCCLVCCVSAMSSSCRTLLQAVFGGAVHLGLVHGAVLVTFQNCRWQDNRCGVLPVSKLLVLIPA